jgi:predicted O-methyltransferase YrrM
MNFLDEQLERFAEEHTSKESALLKELNRETWSKVLRPRMLSGHLQGRVLSLFSKMIRPKRILEIGTYTGYSALCLAEGLSEGGELHTIDVNEELEEMVQSYVDRSDYSEQIHLHIGNALEIIPALKEDWDLVFIDADKINYINYFNLLIDQMKSGTYLIADNVLWSGKVTEDYESLDIETRTLIDYCKLIEEDERVENVLFPIRDGLLIARVL